MQWVWRNRWAAAALLGGLGLRLYFVCALPHVQGDSLVYGDLAKNLLQHHTFGLTEAGNVRPTLIRLPGYPLFVAACFALFGIEHYTAVMLVQLVLDMAACVLLADMARRLEGERVGVAVLAAAALCPFTANYVAAPLTETPAVFCAAAALYALGRWRGSSGWGWICCMGAALAFAVELRPDRALLGIAVFGALVLCTGMRKNRRVWMQLAIVCAMVALPIAAWSVRNWRTFHVVEPLAPKSATDPGEFISKGFNRWYRTWAIEFKSTVDVYWTYDGSPLQMTDLPPRAFDSAEQKAETEAVLEEYNQQTAASPQLDSTFEAIAAERVRTHPIRYYAGLPLARLLNMWLRPREEMIPRALDWWNAPAHGRSSAKSMVYAALNLLYIWLAIAGAVWWRRATRENQQAVSQRMVWWAAVAYVALRCGLLLTLDNSESRYTIDCFPVVVLFAGYAVARISARWWSSDPS